MVIVTLAVGVYSIGCTPWREQYLAEVKGRDNQDAVSANLGPDYAETLRNSAATGILPLPFRDSDRRINSKWRVARKAGRSTT